MKETPSGLSVAELQHLFTVRSVFTQRTQEIGNHARLERHEGSVGVYRKSGQLAVSEAVYPTQDEMHRMNRRGDKNAGRASINLSKPETVLSLHSHPLEPGESPMEYWRPSLTDVGIFLGTAAEGLSQVHGIIVPDGEATHTSQMHVILYGLDHRPAHQARLRDIERAVKRCRGDDPSLSFYTKLGLLSVSIACDRDGKAKPGQAEKLKSFLPLRGAHEPGFFTDMLSW